MTELSFHVRQAPFLLPMAWQHESTLLLMTRTATSGDRGGLLPRGSSKRSFRAADLGTTTCERVPTRRWSGAPAYQIF